MLINRTQIDEITLAICQGCRTSIIVANSPFTYLKVCTCTEEMISKNYTVCQPLRMLYDSNKMEGYRDGHRQINAYYKMVQFIISARNENVEHDTPLISTYQ
jgi:hypothetical protein